LWVKISFFKGWNLVNVKQGWDDLLGLSIKWLSTRGKSEYRKTERLSSLFIWNPYHLSVCKNRYVSFTEYHRVTQSHLL